MPLTDIEEVADQALPHCRVSMALQQYIIFKISVFDIISFNIALLDKCISQYTQTF